MAALCHYCQEAPAYLGMTRDHIVPRSLRPRNAVYVSGVQATVKACHDCNSMKGSKRVVREEGLDHCSLCAAAWVAYGPPGWSVRVSTISVAKVVKKSLRRSRPMLNDMAVLPCG